MERLAGGLELEDGVIRPDRVEYVETGEGKQIGMEIHSGRNRIVRRIFEHLGYKVTRLDRVYYAGLTKKGLTRGRWRHLSPREVSMLKMSVPRKRTGKPARRS
jgi:23S rRNA pseudouridine2605 synthase